MLKTPRRYISINFRAKLLYNKQPEKGTVTSKTLQTGIIKCN